jgi:hypothetical protein
MSLHDKKTLLMRKSIKQQETQVDDMKNLTKIISIATNYAFLIEKKSFLNKKSTNSKTCTTTYCFFFLTCCSPFFLFISRSNIYR